MERALFSVSVADLESGDREMDEEIPVAWLAATLEGTEATPRGKPGRLEVTLSKSGREVMVRGHARAAVTLPCARTLNPADYDLDAEIFLLLAPGASPPAAPKVTKVTKAPKAAKVGKPERPLRDAPRPEKAQKKGSARAVSRQEDQAALGREDAARDTYDGERVVLDAFVREFLVLELPMVPLREDLQSEATPAIERPLAPAPANGSAHEAIDPRLAPLAAIARRLRDKKE